MNYANFIVKIIEEPKQSFFQTNTVVTKMRVKFVPTRKKKINIKDTFEISIWENLSYGTIKYYRLYDYIFIEGYVSLRTNFPMSSQTSQLDKKLEISVFKHYPLFLI